MDPVVFEGDDFGGKAVDESSVMGGYDGSPFEIFEAPSESGDRFEVEMIVRLVENQRIGSCKNQSSQD